MSLHIAFSAGVPVQFGIHFKTRKAVDTDNYKQGVSECLLVSFLSDNLLYCFYI
jgi:hypothetical protein